MRERQIGRLRVAMRQPAGGDGPTPLELEVARVRAAGGPRDNATYTCSCGYLFSASVSTTVSCPHCGSKQAW